MSGLNKKEILKVYKEGKKICTNNFVMYYSPLETLKVSPVVSKKISKKAVIRNKIKRRIRHLFRDRFKSGAFIVVVKNDILNTNFEELKNEIKKISNKID